MIQIAYATAAGSAATTGGMGSTVLMIVLMIAIFYFLMIRPETSEDRVRVEFLKSAIGQVGTLDEQAAAQQRPAKKDKKADKAQEAPAVEEKASEETDSTDAE